MKFIFALLALSISTISMADTHVKGYTKSDGTYVEPHYRSDSNNTKFDNYNTKGNVNPYTGKEGAVDPYATPEIKTYSPPTYK